MKYKAILATIITLTLVNCSTFYIKRNHESKLPDASNIAKGEKKVNSFIWGFVVSQAGSISDLCPGSRVDAMKIYMNSSDVLIATATLGIYVPQTLQYACGP